MGNWTAEITNNSDDDYNLIIEILKDDKFVGRIQKIDKELILKIYKTDIMLDIPVDWLRGILDGADKDLK